MTQNPYAQFGQPGLGGGGEILEPLDRRTSVLAILSLIAALLCFLPGAGALAAILGGAAVIFISQSRGRLGGMGLAVTGIVLGLLFSLLQIAIVVGVSSIAGLVNNSVFGPAAKVVEAIDKGDRTGSRAMFTTRADAAITDQMLDDFAQRLRDELGAYEGSPKGMIELISGFAATGPRMAVMQGRNDLFPVPVKFARGQTVAVFEMDQADVQRNRGNRGPNFRMPIVNVGVIGLTPGKVIWLMPPEESYKLRVNLGATSPVKVHVEPDAPSEKDGDEADEPGERAPEAPQPPTPPSPPAPGKPDTRE